MVMAMLKKDGCSSFFTSHVEDGFEMGLAILANLAILADLAILANSENLVSEKPKYWSEKLSLSCSPLTTSHRRILSASLARLD